MPLLTVCTNTTIDNPEALALDASKFVAELLAKPESYVMIKIQSALALSFAGSNESAAHLQLKSLGLPESQTTQFSAALCEFIGSALGIKSDRIYIEFSNPERAMWGWDNRTFG